MLLKEYCDGTPLVPAEVRKRWESSYGDKQGQLTRCEATGCTNAESAATAAASVFTNCR